MMLNTYYKDRLTPNQQKAYDEICSGVRLCASKISVRDTKDFAKVVSAVNYDHPEFFHVNFSEGFSYTKQDNYRFIKMHYLYRPHEIAVIQGKSADIARKIGGVSDYGKILAVHDWIVTHIHYDSRGLRTSPHSPTMYSVAGALLRKKAVCAGISKLACWLLRQKGVDVAVVIGTSDTGEGHAWNACIVNKQLFYMDVTYDLSMSDRNRIQRKYFMLSEEAMKRDHVFTDFP